MQYILKSSVPYETHEGNLFFILTWYKELSGKIHLRDPPCCAACFWKEEAVSILELGMYILRFIGGRGGQIKVGKELEGRCFYVFHL